jgi:uncharacterized protein (DUF983 family)
VTQPRPLAEPGVWQALGRALRLRCPRCGRGALWARAFTMHAACSACGLRYEREPGYFVGAIYVNYAITVALALGGVLALDLAIGLSLRAQLTLAVATAALVPIALFRYARSLWLALDYLVSRADDRSTRRQTR